jgi:GH18 family chitinase
LAFAQIQEGNNSFYTDYSASGNFQLPTKTGPYQTWNSWLLKYWPSGGRAYVSYGGGTNSDFRGYVIHSSIQQLGQLAGEIKANIAKYYFDGVELDIENWWSYGLADNQQFATNLATMIKILRTSLDSDPNTKDKPIIIAVGYEAAGKVEGLPSNLQYAGSMNSLFRDVEAMNDISAVNIMAYNTGVANFYSRYDLVDGILNNFVNAGVSMQQIIFGVQPCESSGKPATSTDAITKLGQHIVQNHFGGMFMWGIGADGMCKQDPKAYLTAMKLGLGLN